MGTGMPLGGRGGALLPPPMPGPWVGKGLEGEGAPTLGGLAGTAGLGLTSGGTTSDMSVDKSKDKNKTSRKKKAGTRSRTEESSETFPLI